MKIEVLQELLKIAEFDPKHQNSKWEALGRHMIMRLGLGRHGHGLAYPWADFYLGQISPYAILGAPPVQDYATHNQ